MFDNTYQYHNILKSNIIWQFVIRINQNLSIIKMFNVYYFDLILYSI